MKKREALRLRPGDPVRTYNGPYTQTGRVVEVTTDAGGVWVSYEWAAPDGRIKSGCKRAASVHALGYGIIAPDLTEGR